MSTFTANATVEGEKISATANVNIGGTVKEAIEHYGEATVYELYSRGATLAVQQRLGALLRSGASPKDAGKDVSENFRLDQRATRPKKSMEDKVSKLFEGLSAEQVAEVLKNAGLK